MEEINGVAKQNKIKRMKWQEWNKRIGIERNNVCLEAFAESVRNANLKFVRAIKHDRPISRLLD